MFGIVCRDFYPAASNGDYTMIKPYPHTESQMIPATFTVTFM